MASVLPRRCMQQTAILIITFLAYVAGIRNGGGSSNHHNYASTSFPHAQEDDFFSAQSLQEITSNTQNSGGFRPSQMVEFTTADATAPHRYPPTYEDTNYSTLPAPTQIQSTAEVRYDMEKQFAFPTNDNEEPQQLAATTMYNNRYTNNKYNYNYQTNGQSESTIPTQLQSTPILTYHDSFTNENYHYTPTPIKQTSNHYQEHRPQEYTVQSSLLVGADKYGYQQQQHQQQQQQQQQHPVYPQYQRPGYVIDEQLSPSYERPVYTQQPHKYAQYQQQQQQQQQQQHPNALPHYNRELPERRPKPELDQSPGPHSKPHLSYDSHDYPPPTYFEQLQQQQQQQKQQQSTHPFQSPQRQDTRPPAYASTSPNYANNFGNYLQGDGSAQYPGNYNRPIPSPSGSPAPPYNFVNEQQYTPAQRPTQQRPPRPPPSAYNPYNEYQQGELPPPSASYNPNYRPPPYRPQAQQPPASGLASLASLFTTTQQYAPQFTNLLLGGGGGSSTSASNPLGSLLGALTGGTPAYSPGSSSGYGGGGSPSRPLNMQVIKALENIARNDDLQCVPKVLCQMIAGQTQRGQLPSVITSPAITNFLAGFPAASPALIYGRAALLGISGGDRSCAQTYAQCPKNEYEILHYLNNHRGGFFKFFSEPEEQTTTQSSSSNGSGGGGGASTSLFSILSALAGNSPPPTTTPRPTRRPTTAPSLDITSGIGNFFSNVLSEYLGGGGGGGTVEYQRRRRRSLFFNDDEPKEIDATLEQETETAMAVESDEDFHDDEDDEDTQTDDLDMALSNEQSLDVEARILHHKDVSALDGPKFFPEIENHQADELKNIIKVFNKVNAQRKLKFPSETTVREYKDMRELDAETEDDNGEEDHRDGKQVNFRDDETYDDFKVNHFDFDTNKDNNRNAKKVVFKDTDEEDQSPQYSGVVSTRHEEQQQRPTRGARVIFPDHYESMIRKGRILNRPTYADTYSDYVRSHDDDSDKLVVSNSHRKPHYQSTSDNSLSINNNYNNNAYISQSTSSTTNNNNYVNYGGSKYSSDSNNNRYQRPTSTATSSYNQNYDSNSSSNYNYPNNNYVSNNRYGSNYANRYTTRSPYVKVQQQQDDKNVYVTNGRGMTEYYITPEGRKVYL